MRQWLSADLVRRFSLSWLFFFAFAGISVAEIELRASGTSIPYVPTRHDVVRDMLWLADVGKDDIVYDLGSGDGRILIAGRARFWCAQGSGRGA